MPCPVQDSKPCKNSCHVQHSIPCTTRFSALHNTPCPRQYSASGLIFRVLYNIPCAGQYSVSCSKLRVLYNVPCPVHCSIGLVVGGGSGGTRLVSSRSQPTEPQPTTAHKTASNPSKSASCWGQLHRRQRSYPPAFNCRNAATSIVSICLDMPRYEPHASQRDWQRYGRRTLRRRTSLF
jgi:hypothetical protein